MVLAWQERSVYPLWSGLICPSLSWSWSWSWLEDTQVGCLLRVLPRVDKGKPRGTDECIGHTELGA